MRGEGARVRGVARVCASGCSPHARPCRPGKRQTRRDQSVNRAGPCPVKDLGPALCVAASCGLSLALFLHQSFLIWCKNETRSRNDRTTVMLLVATEIHQNCPSLSYQL